MVWFVSFSKKKKRSGEAERDGKNFKRRRKTHSIFFAFSLPKFQKNVIVQRHYYFMHLGNGEVIDACRKVRRARRKGSCLLSFFVFQCFLHRFAQPVSLSFTPLFNSLLFPRAPLAASSTTPASPTARPRSGSCEESSPSASSPSGTSGPARS